MTEEIDGTGDAMATGGGRATADEARALLDTVSKLRRRARDARHHTWVLAFLLGVALVVGAPVDRLFALGRPVAHCLSGLVDPGTDRCARVGLSPVARPGHRHGVAQAMTGTVTSGGHAVTGVVAGQVPSAWALGSSDAYWALAVTAAFVVAALARLGRTSARALKGAAVAMTVAVGAGVGVDVLFHSVATISPLANIVTVGVALGVAAVAERSRALFVVGSTFVVSAVILPHLVGALVLNRLKVVVPPTSLAQALAGLVLVTGALVLRWRHGVAPLRRDGRIFGPEAEVAGC